MTRKLEEASEIQKLKGAEIILADFNDPKSLHNVLTGMKHAFLLCSSSAKAEQLQLNFVAAAKAKGLEHLVKLSQLHADINSPVRFLRYHAKVEDAIEKAGIAYTFLRPNLFMQGLLGFKIPIARKGKFFATIGDAKVSLIDIRDIAAVIIETLQGKSHYNKIYNLTGPEALTHDELAYKFSKALGKPVKYINVFDEELQSTLLVVGFPDWQANGLIEDYAHYARGEAETVTGDIKFVTGKKPRSFEEFLKSYGHFFQV